MNLTWLIPGRVGGSEEYLTRQLSGLDPNEFDVELVCDPGFPAAHPELAARFRTVPMPISGRAARIPLEHSWLAVRSRHADVVHHGGGTMPLVGSRPAVLTVHDLQYLQFPGYFSDARRRYLSAMMPRSVARAAVIAVPSQFVRRHVVEAFGVPEGRVCVVPHGVPELAQPDTRRIAEVADRHGVAGQPYVVYPAITHPHKAHRVLIDMMDHLDSEVALVLIGGTGSAEAEVASAIADSAQRHRIFRPGRVDDADRNALIAGAEALVFPSEFEGFGAPVVEAMELGTPVVSSSAAALVEAVADAAVTVCDASGTAWADAVADARRRRSELIALGRVRRQAFTVDASSRAIGEAYRQASS